MNKSIPTKTTMLEPPPDFVKWWNPQGTDPVSGADVGGHPEAKRVHARKDPGKWAHGTFGITATIAWNTTKLYRAEYERWVDAGRPKREPYVSIAASLERQKAFWKEIKQTVADIGKPVPQPHPLDYDTPSDFEPY